MKKCIFPLVLLLLAGCASSDRMARMSAGVFDEYSAPKSTRIRSEKYQKMSREFSSPRRSSKVTVSTLDDTLVNIWPFFFRSNAYWTILWPFIDKDPYGFAIRPFYNHEGDDYSVLFPLSAWNTAGKHGWVTLFAWKSSGFGFVPFTWQWKDGLTGGAYYTPLFICKYDKNPLIYKEDNGFVMARWSVNELFGSCFGVIYDRYRHVDSGDKSWLMHLKFDDKAGVNLWNYHFQGKKPFPKTPDELFRLKQKTFAEMPRYTEKTYGFVPLWIGTFDEKGNYSNRFLLVAGNSRSDNGKNYSFDIFGEVLGMYELKDKSCYFSDKEKTEEFTSWLLFSKFTTDYCYEQNKTWRIFNDIDNLIYPTQKFSRNKPEMESLLKKLDPNLKLPPTVVDSETCSLFIRELRSKYTFPTYKEYRGGTLPLFFYTIKKDYSSCFLVPLLTWWENGSNYSKFRSLPLMTFISRDPAEDSTVIFTPLAYYAKEKHRDREDYPVFANDCQRVQEYDCAELRDQYALCGLFYRGRFGFNIAKAGFDSAVVEDLRYKLRYLPSTANSLESRRSDIERKKLHNDRWMTATEIERLKKLIRYEELKIERQKLEKDEKEYAENVRKALEIAEKIGFKADKDCFADRKKADEARKKLVHDYSELRYYEDIGNGLFFRKEKNFNGDHNWHFMHILAGGEKTGDRESTHILHLLYRYRKEGTRSETICFPFISTVKDGENSRVSFLWRVFSLSKKNGKTGGHIFFIPFGSEW